MVGNRANFNDYDILRCFLAVGKKISRSSLVDELELGEGTVRGILSVLKKKGLISSTRLGHSLSEKGKNSFAGLGKKISLIKKTKTGYYSGKQAAVLVKAKKRFKVGFKERDAAIRNGADAALVLVYDKKLKAPGIDQSFPDLEKLFEFKKNNILVVSFAGNYRDAANSALAVCSGITKISI